MPTLANTTTTTTVTEEYHYSPAELKADGGVSSSATFVRADFIGGRIVCEFGAGPADDTPNVSDPDTVSAKVSWSKDDLATLAGVDPASTIVGTGWPLPGNVPGVSVIFQLP